jgi:hypothetical protein
MITGSDVARERGTAWDELTIKRCGFGGIGSYRLRGRGMLLLTQGRHGAMAGILSVDTDTADWLCWLHLKERPSHPLPDMGRSFMALADTMNKTASFRMDNYYHARTSSE